jgi:hypothetical protein
MYFEKLGAIFVYLLMFAVLSATSILLPPAPTGTFLFSTDCTSPYSETEVGLSSGVITSPGGSTFSDFGLPVGTFYGEGVYTGTISGQTRTCDRLIGSDRDSDEWAYSCKYQGTVVCTVLIQRR